MANNDIRICDIARKETCSAPVNCWWGEASLFSAQTVNYCLEKEQFHKCNCNIL